MVATELPSCAPTRFSAGSAIGQPEHLQDAVTLPKMREQAALADYGRRPARTQS